MVQYMVFQEVGIQVLHHQGYNTLCMPMHACMHAMLIAQSSYIYRSQYTSDESLQEISTEQMEVRDDVMCLVAL